jgi:O-methyltransferase
MIDKLIEDVINKQLTMVGKECFDTVIDLQQDIRNLEGDIIECGIWRGGFLIFLAKLFEEKNIYGVDSFCGFQELADAKYEYNRERHVGNATKIGTPFEFVENKLKEYDLNGGERVKLVKGFVRDVLNDENIKSKKIALLRIDVDGYSPTLEVLDALYDKVEIGGYIIFDDACLYECADAMRFFSKKFPHLKFYHPQTHEEVNINTRMIHSDSGLISGTYTKKLSF